MAPTDTPSNPKMQETVQKIADLRAAIDADDPMFATHLRAIHNNLIKYEELAMLLSEAQIAVIINGAEKKLGIVLAAETTGTKPGKGKSLKNVSAADL